MGGLFGHRLRDPYVTVTSGGIYVAWQLTPLGSAGARSELARIDAATGTIRASTRLNAAVSQVLQTAGALWVATSADASPATVTLLRLSPGTLRVTRRWRLGTTAMPPRGGQLVVAGGWLWAAAGNRVLRLSLPGGTTTGSIVLPGAASSNLSANTSGTVLVIGEADRAGRGAVERRDPATGALLASHPVGGVVAPEVAGPVGSSVWMSEATGMLGYVQRLDATTMTARSRSCPEGGMTRTCVTGTSGITARVANGLLWVTQFAGGNRRNYCADPVTGRELAPIRLPRPTRDMVLAIGPHQIFYLAPGPGVGQYLRQMTIPGSCQAR